MLRVDWSTIKIQFRDETLVHFGGPGVDLHLGTAPPSGRRSGLEQALRDAIRTGRLAPHTRMPATRKLAADPFHERSRMEAENLR